MNLLSLEDINSIKDYLVLREYVLQLTREIEQLKKEIIDNENEWHGKRSELEGEIYYWQRMSSSEDT